MGPRDRLPFYYGCVTLVWHIRCDSGNVSPENYDIFTLRNVNYSELITQTLCFSYQTVNVYNFILLHFMTNSRRHKDWHVPVEYEKITML